jgi:predicted nucleotidyltransferase
MERFRELRDKVLPVLLPWGVTRIALFGSVVRGEDAPGSDIDILVELKDPGARPAIGLRWFGLEEELRALLGREVELVTASALSPYIRPYVEEEMVILYEEG